MSQEPQDQFNTSDPASAFLATGYAGQWSQGSGSSFSTLLNSMRLQNAAAGGSGASSRPDVQSESTGAEIANPFQAALARIRSENQSKAFSEPPSQDGLGESNDQSPANPFQTALTRIRAENQAKAPSLGSSPNGPVESTNQTPANPFQAALARIKAENQPKTSSEPGPAWPNESGDVEELDSYAATPQMQATPQSKTQSPTSDLQPVNTPNPNWATR